MHVVAVIQARMGSTRLPRKVLTPLAGRPVLGWLTRSLEACDELDEIVLATSTEAGDDALAAYAAQHGVRCVRGPERDVLSRYLLALEETAADAVVRITADCPLLDPSLVDLVVAVWRSDPSWEYVATTLQRSLPRGLDVELVSAPTLRGLDESAVGFHRQHVTSLLYREPAGRRLLGLCVAPRADDLRVTLDTAEDLALLQAVTEALGDRIVGWAELVAFLRSRRDVVQLNAAVAQKSLEAG